MRLPDTFPISFEPIRSFVLFCLDETFIFWKISKTGKLSEIIMSAMTFGQKKFNPTPPEKGSFPLDHLGECKAQMVKYMKCLRTHKNENSKCRLESKEYLQCRMDNDLMKKEDWKKLGLNDIENVSKDESDNSNKSR
ncbi:unnamed protein product [Owenia fusiformis]|uniref:Uncharacterized protein n=1 Tax=Owenia fusiformis TaxID=6347 RepID=A0A8J1Y013_OWEFU|nr:unnamed protein product [Owenia fusiformis]